MILRYASLTAASVVAFTAMQAQVSFGGRPYGLTKSHQLTDAPLAVMPLVDGPTLMAEDEARRLQGIKGPYRFGFNHMVDLGMENSGAWHTMPNGDAVWRLAIECPGAYSINFEFHDYVVPEGAKVFVYNLAGEVLGAFTAESNPGNTILGVTQLAGDRITIEYVEPAAVRGLGRLRVGQVTHAYRDIMHADMSKGFGTSGSCNNNVICAVGDNWRPQIRSVAMITVGGSGICTGQLINNCANDGTPYFLTANHCLGGNNSWVFRFNWNSPTCTPTTNAPTNQTVSGSTLKASSAGSDVALLQLNSTPPAGYNVYYTGWDKGTTPPTASTCIHHPDGDIKKISFDTNPATNANFGGAACWRIATWEDGTTEPGSSGSGLWNQNGLLIGQLYGGVASCSNNVDDYFGRFSTSYPTLQTWLGNCGNTLAGFPITTGVADAAEVTTLTIAPNPTTGSITITLPTTMQDGGKVDVYDAVGQLVISKNVRNGSDRLVLDLAGRTEGIYLLEATADGYRSVQRIVLTH